MLTDKATNQGMNITSLTDAKYNNVITLKQQMCCALIYDSLYVLSSWLVEVLLLDFMFMSIGIIKPGINSEVISINQCCSSVVN